MDSSLYDVFRVSGWLEVVAGGLTRLGGTDVLVAAALVSAYLMHRVGLGWWGACGPLGSLWFCAIVTSYLKDVVDRGRPAAGAGMTSASFPSGHAANTTAFVVALALVMPLATTAVSRKRAVAVSLAVSLLIGWTRLALGVHWASDVVAGWVLGGVVAVFVMRVVVAREEPSAPDSA